MASNLLTPALTVFEQMALDEVLAKAALSGPVLRFYHWAAGPAVTFGYAQFYQAVRRQTQPEHGPLCRRPTGGGLVFHQTDLTFSLVFESTLRPVEIYACLHGAIEQSLAQAQLLRSVRQGEVAPGAYMPNPGGQASGCFASPVKDDLLSDGRKILGGAIRRFDKRVLYQGSLQCPQARTNPAFRRSVAAGVSAWLGSDFHTQPVAQQLLAQAKQLAVSQYQTAAWTEKFL